ncbi:interferon omega-1-like [Glossophaga mutica]
MARIYLCLAAGLMLCSIPARSLGGDLLSIHSPDNHEISALLRQLNTIPPQSCLNDGNDFKCPWKRGTIAQMHRTQRGCFHHPMLQQIFELFATEHSHAAWNRTVLYHLSSVHHSLESLGQTEEENLACPCLGSPVRKYFQRIRNYLKEEKFSSCAWEVVRVQIAGSLPLMQPSSKRGR